MGPTPQTFSLPGQIGVTYDLKAEKYRTITRPLAKLHRRLIANVVVRRPSSGPG